jgi:hypothetical protein
MDRDTFIHFYLDGENTEFQRKKEPRALNIESKPVDLNIATHVFKSQRLRLKKEDFQHPLFLNPSNYRNLLHFILLVAETHPRFQRSWNPPLWDGIVRQIWEIICPTTPSYMRYSGLSVEKIIPLIKTFDDLHAYFRQLIGVWEYVDPIHLATRPSYMLKHGDQAEPYSGIYTVFFQRLFEQQNLAVLLASPAEVSGFFNSFTLFLPKLANEESIIRNAWVYSSKRFYQTQRSLFKKHTRQLLIATVMSPRRVQACLEAYGFEGLEQTFG